MTTKKQELQLKDEIEMEVIEVLDAQLTPVQYAMSKGASMDELEKFMQLQERSERYEAEKAFNLAMSMFAANAPTITKDAHVSFGNTDYKHATLGNVVSTIVKALSEQGLSHRWRTAQEGANITVTCVITHKLGHSEETSLMANADTSGSIKGIQAVASTITYLERYTLLAATGCATANQDDDGIAAGDRLTIADNQVEYLENLMKTSTMSLVDICNQYQIMSVSELQQRDYKEMVYALGGKF